jgi:radical SAM superfamily enzyme YgiQ (UPF0313 family)
MKNILLIAPKSINKNSSELSILKTPLSGLLVLATMLRNKRHNVRFIDESFKVPDYDEVDNLDLVLISSMSTTVNRAYTLADMFRNRGIKVILGGVHVSFMANEALNHCDQVVIGEAEDIIFDLVEGKFKSKIVRGLPTENLSRYPMPDYSLVEGIKKEPDIVSVVTSRGCPFACKFCSLVNMFGTKLRSVPTNLIINYLLKFEKLKVLAFDEPNFTINKERSVDILQEMKNNGIFPKNCLASVSVDVANNDRLLKLMIEVSNFTLLVGLESISQKSLDFYNKKQTPEMIKKSIKKLHDFGIKIIGCFIFGADGEDKSIFQKTIDFCHSADIDFPTFACLTPYVGTHLRSQLELENRIFNNNWDFYDTLHTVFFPQKMSPLELQEGVINAYENLYSTRKIFTHLKRKEIFEATQKLHMRRLLKRGIKQNKSYPIYLQDVSIKAL